MIKIRRLNLDVKIKYGVSPKNEVFVEIFARIFAPILFLATVYLLFIRGHLAVLHDRVFRLRLANSTSRNTVRPCACGIPYDELRCSVLETTNAEILKKCISDSFLLFSRLLLPVLVAVKAYLLHIFFTIDGQHSRLVVCILRIIGTFLLVCVACGVHDDSCFHHIVSLLFSITTIISTFALWSHIIGCITHRSFSRNIDAIVDLQSIEVDNGSTEPIHNRSILWRKVL